MSVFVVWYRWSDLRLTDHEPLVAAEKAAAKAMQRSGAAARVMHLHVIEHELVHLLQQCDCVPSGAKRDHHGAWFQRAAKALFGHRSFKHDLVTMHEIAHERFNVSVGGMVRFTIKGEGELKGKVNRINKRATILVEDTSGRHPDARPFSDGRSYRKFFVPVQDCRPA